jgi:trimeric autotransporter adhesin
MIDEKATTLFSHRAEAKGYRVRKVHPGNGGMRTILDLTTFSDPASSPTTKWRKNYSGNAPQGGLMGLAIHPDYLTASNKYVYIAYIRDFVGNNQTYNGEFVNGDLYITWLVRFEYAFGMLRNPMAICDTIRGSNDHNSGRMIIAREGGGSTWYLYYAVGDMGAGQFANTGRVIKAQWNNSYEGKILRYNLDGTIPSSNPYGSGSAIWCKGVRNNQGFAYARINGVDLLYGTSHGPFSDDELNILENGRNFGHPVVIGKKSDNNYNGSKAATPASILPTINNENNNGDTMVNYKDALFTAYASTQSAINTIYTTNPPNGDWPSEGWSGVGIYTGSKIPGWKNSIVAASLKWGRLVKIRLSPDGQSVIPTGATDTVSYFGSRNRFRDVAFDPNNPNIMYVVMDASTTSSGPSEANPIVPNCLGCIHRYTFLGYADNAGASTIPNTIPVARSVPNTCVTANTITIDASNNNIWVPITDDSSNIIAEIDANGNNLGVVTTSFFYKNSGAVREESSSAKKMYMDRNITITPTVQPSSNVNVRFYLTAGELARVQGQNNSIGQANGITGINSISVFKSNVNTCTNTIGTTATRMTTTRLGFGSNYVLTASIPSFSSFFFANGSMTTLPVNLLSFTGTLKSDKSVELVWKTNGEVNTSKYEIERSIDGQTYTAIGSKPAIGTAGDHTYAHNDNTASGQPTLLIYYRLRMIDADDNFKYSDIVTVALDGITGKVIVTPNPASAFTKLTITAGASGNAQWQIVDNSGRIVTQGNMQLRSGVNSNTINTSKLAAGMYFINVSGAGINERIKLQKL